MEERFDNLMKANLELINCVEHLIMANHDMFEVLTMLTGMREGLQESERLPEDCVKRDLTGKVISV